MAGGRDTATWATTWAAAGLGLSALVGGGCTLDIVDRLVNDTQIAEGETETEADGADEGGAEAGDADEGGAEDGGAGGDEGGPEVPLFDVGGAGSPVSSCEFAAQFPSHIGCEFYGLDLDGPGLADSDPFGFIVINPLPDPVEVTLERHHSGGGPSGSWTLVDTAMIAGEDEHVWLPQDANATFTGVHEHASFRVTGAAPIIVIQATPAAGTAASASATMLQPSAAWATVNPVAGWRTHPGVGEHAFLGIVARTSATPVAIRPVFEIADAPPEWAADWIDPQTLLLALEPGQMLRVDAGAIDAAEVDHGTSGSVIESGQEHLISVFSAHTCAAIPDYAGTCGHMQEQLSPRLLGTRFVAPRLVAVDAGLGPDAPLGHEPTMFQVVATEANTEVVFSAYDPELDAGVAFEVVTIDPDEPYAIYSSELDVTIEASHPILAAAYMTNAELSALGSPSMVALAPVEQWSSYHWIWVPEGFETHAIVSAPGFATVEVEGVSGLDGSPAPASPASLVEQTKTAGPGLGPWNLRRFALAPGVHRIQSSGPSSVVVAGWRTGDGFAYLGGWGPSLADLGPPG